MLFRKRQKEDNKKGLRELIKDIKIQLVTLDHDYHRLFHKEEKNKTINQLEEKLNGLLKERGKLTNAEKKNARLKKQLMEEILKRANENLKKPQTEEESDHDEIAGYKTRIEELAVEDDNNEKRLLQLPKEIESINKELFIECVDLCYNNMKQERTERDQLAREIEELRSKLKEKVVRKKEIEEDMDQYYQTFHHLIGVDNMNKIDRHYGYGGTLTDD